MQLELECLNRLQRTFNVERRPRICTLLIFRTMEPLETAMRTREPLRHFSPKIELLSLPSLQFSSLPCTSAEPNPTIIYYKIGTMHTSNRAYSTRCVDAAHS